MNVLILLVFVGIMVVTLALVLFAWTLRGGTFDHSDRLALLPLADDAPTASTASATKTASTASATKTASTASATKTAPSPAETNATETAASDPSSTH